MYVSNSNFIHVLGNSRACFPIAIQTTKPYLASTKSLAGGGGQRERERRGGGRGSSYCTPFSTAFSLYTENKEEEIRVKWSPALPMLKLGSHQIIFRTVLQDRMLGPPCLGFRVKLHAG